MIILIITSLMIAPVWPNTDQTQDQQTQTTGLRLLWHPIKPGNAEEQQTQTPSLRLLRHR